MHSRWLVLLLLPLCSAPAALTRLRTFLPTVTNQSIPGFPKILIESLDMDEDRFTNIFQIGTRSDSTVMIQDIADGSVVNFDPLLKNCTRKDSLAEFRLKLVRNLDASDGKWASLAYWHEGPYNNRRDARFQLVKDGSILLSGPGSPNLIGQGCRVFLTVNHTDSDSITAYLVRSSCPAVSKASPRLPLERFGVFQSEQQFVIQTGTANATPLTWRLLRHDGRTEASGIQGSEDGTSVRISKQGMSKGSRILQLEATGSKHSIPVFIPDR